MEIYHVLNRGVDKRTVFQDDYDRMRFMQGLYVYNNQNLINRNIRRYTSDKLPPSERVPLVKIHAFCLMGNHYHILLSPIESNIENISAFMRKLNMGYSKYFNEKYERSGALWQGKYKKIHIHHDNHFNYIPYYIHLNPLDSTFPEWRNGDVKDYKAALNFLLKYKWSSFLDYSNIKNYPSIIDKTLLRSQLGNVQHHHAEVQAIIQDPIKSSFSNIIEIDT